MNAYIGVVGFTLAITLPFYWEKQIKHLFEKDLQLEFTDEGFSLLKLNLRDGDYILQDCFNWSSIRSYRFEFTRSQYTILNVYLKAGCSKKYVFIDNKTESQSIKEESIFSVFRTFIKGFNKDQEPYAQIHLSPGFMSKPLGILLLVLLLILTIVSISLRVMYAELKFVVLIVFGASTLFALLLLRYAQRQMYRRMLALDKD